MKRLAAVVVLAVALVAPATAQAHDLSLSEAKAFNARHNTLHYPNSNWCYHSAIRINSTALKLRWWGCFDHSKRLGCTVDHDHGTVYLKASCVRWWY